MNDDLTPAQRASLHSLRASRGHCPSAEMLVEYEALNDAGRSAHPAHAHIVACSRCQLALLHMEDAGATGLSRRSSQDGSRAEAEATGWMRWAVPLAAVALLGVALTLVDRGTVVAPGNQGVDTVRGTELQPIAPAGATEQLREFSWQSPIRAERYRVIVRRGATVVWQAETTGLSMAPPQPGTIERDVQYEWRVEALDGEGNVRMTSPPQSFVVY